MKKLFTILALILLCVCCAACFTACEGKNVDILHTHTFVDTVINPTCTSGGYTLHKCECGEEYKDNFTDALSHNYINGKCSLCGASDPNYVEPVEECTHDYAWTIIKNPTCTEKGEKTATCTLCFATKTEEINATGHKFTNYVSDGNATYENDGTKTAYCNNGCGAKDTIPDIGSKLVHTGIKFNALTTNGTNVNGKVPNEQTTFSFLTEISVSGNATFSVSYDINGNNKIPTKTANLNVGDNVFYVLEEINGNASNLFTVTIRRKPIYTVSFNTNGGTNVASQQIEEDNFANEPSALTRAGYNFISWDYDFDEPIKGNTTINAQWNYFTLTTTRNDTSAGTVTTHNETKISIGESVTITATTNAGYKFIGWFNGETELDTNLSYTFDMLDENLIYTAKWEIAAEMLNFNFTSSTSTCAITGIKDKTIAEIIVPDYITQMSRGVFSGCFNLVSITIPFVGERVKTVSDTYQSPFGSIFGTSSYIGGTATEQKYYGGSIGSTTNTTYYIPSSLKRVIVTGGNILYGAFYNCSGLTSIKIPDNVTSIGAYAFRGCSSLIRLKLPDSVITIGTGAFHSCIRLKSVNIPNSISIIEGLTFYNCRSLTNITIPESVNNIGYYAFEYCWKLVEIYNKSELIITAGNSYKDNGRLGAFAKNVYTPTNGMSKLHTDSNGYIIFSDGTDNILMGYKGTETDLTLPYGATEIYSLAFVNDCSLTNITISDGITIIGGNAFSRCVNLTSITLSSSLKVIGWQALNNCVNLTDIIFMGTREQWESVEKDGGWNYKVPAQVVHCSDGDINI